ncbi:urease accessory protein UreF [Paenibacillus thiaminolyticus]|uniref:Urease accessory protein UreF n=1 Tax=Paenibacillus thiaminolyticus TaxID=49283 RepID=A0AAP9DYU5_PANTH|nr:urease accessory protein UreF [Paenibacillus thiaminolyticus]MCY9537136.1 urease accessory protein UreF [Paenibacillus thiaminolyticus]MCY9603105.1 urease accessory protein UreF [Paenibacillus thiaminolyticus]MCY9607935.1 urease accessory protein UreF [Paenibacillus thiaminolyticus]MCY9613552.1 urease accessory protein UreF [Paenibacillus thiaminolyticus]MCY9618714.1 urease accessory protein UreF [Paenibacillus thiaminolyticus]
MSDISTSSLLTLLQWCDSNFPSGAFNHSFGLETYMQAGQVTDKASFKLWLEAYVLEQLVFNDLLACRLAYEALEGNALNTNELNANELNANVLEANEQEANELEEIWRLDRLMAIQCMPRETREGMRRIGERMVKLATALYDSPALAQYSKRLAVKELFGHPAIAFAMMAFHVGVGKESAVLSCLYSSVSGMVQNGVRAIPLGQTDGQKLLRELQPLLEQAAYKVQTLTIDDLGVVAPGLECAQMRHEQLHIRLFMS